MTVVTDTSVLLNLCWLKHEWLLAEFFQRVLAPTEVRDEFEHLAIRDSRFTGLSFPSSIEIDNASQIPQSLRLEYRLDTDEIAALALALERGIQDVLIDERAGRMVAMTLGLRPSGLLGLLVRGNAVLPLLNRLQAEARFRVSEELHAQIVKLAGE